MSSSFSTEGPKDAGCHCAELSQCNKKSVIGVIVQVSRSLQFRPAITHHSNIYSNHSACSQFFGHVAQCLQISHCCIADLHWGSSFSAARLNAAVCCLCLERWWLGPLLFLMFILRHDKSTFVVHQKFPVERMTGSCLVMFTGFAYVPLDVFLLMILMLNTQRRDVSKSYQAG